MDYWYREANFYHIYPLGLCHASFENNYAAVENRLGEIGKWVSHIKEMGCNAVYFGPVFKAKTHGYDTTDYFQIDNRIGDNDGFKELIDLLHANDIRVVLDGVFNHCGRDFFAFRNVCERGEHSEYCSWFSGVDFSRRSPLGDPFTYDTWNGYYELVKFNLRNPSLREYLFAAVKYWLEFFNIDGLRLDAADCLDFDFMKELRWRTTDFQADFWLMGEVVHGDYSRWANGELLHSVTNYELYKGLYSSHNDRNLFEVAYSLNRQFAADGGIYRNFLPYNFVDNHDQSRLASIAGNPHDLYTIYLLLYTVPGIPSIYYGSEWGIKGIKGGDSDRQLRPYLDLHNISGSEMHLKDVIKKLSAIRNENKVLSKGSYKQILVTYEQQFAFERALGNEKITVVINTADQEAAVKLPGYGGKFYDLLNGENFSGEEIQVSPHWGRILKIN